MPLLYRHRWFVAAVGATLAFAAVSLTARPGLVLAVFGDLILLLLFLSATAAAVANALRTRSQGRTFWVLIALGLSLWTSNAMAWAYFDLVLRRPIPDPYVFDVVLFFHVVPMIATVAWRPDLQKANSHFSVLSFLMLLGWWLFLYAFLVFPHQYVILNADLYNFYYERLYMLENTVLLVVLAVAWRASSAGWRRLYLHFLGAAMVYTVGAPLLNLAVASNTYYPGSRFEIPLIASLSWITAIFLSAREWDLQALPPSPRALWRRILSRLAMLAILSLPALGLWEIFFDRSLLPSRVFRLFAVLTGMLVLGAFVFLRQYTQDQVLIGLLQESRRSYDTQVRLQKQLVQREKLTSLGTLVAGAAHEINHPLTAIINHSEQLWGHERLTEEQKNLLRKIVSQAQRTHELVGNLLSFARQTPGDKAPVDLSLLINRAIQMLEPRYPGGSIRISLSIAPDFPSLRGNANQLFQVFVEIIENAMDALQEVGGGSLDVNAKKQGDEALMEFSDSGPGIRQPERVFDPFYTTKPVGKGTGLGLSVVYGLVQDHGGQITCQNKPDGGALFVLRFPASAEPAVHVAGASGD